MIAHLVLFSPRPDLPESAKQRLTESFEAVLQKVPSIRRARVGTRLTHGRAYEGLMAVDYQYAAVIEFDDVAGLKAYLEHPAHEELGSQFSAVCEHALIYDFDLKEGSTAGGSAANQA